MILNLKKLFNINNILKIIDIVICFCILFLALKKGGFYTSDCIYFNLITSFLGLLYISLNCFFYDSIKNSKANLKINYLIQLLIVLLPISYILPIIFKKTSNFNDSFFEMIRYLDFAILFFTIWLSKNKKYYINTMVILAIIQSIIGIDGIGLRYFEKVLNVIDSGYLDIDLNRMSGTIQYANTFAIIQAISFLILLDKFSLNIKKAKKDNHRNESIINLFILIGMYLNLSSILLSNSRLVLIFFVFTIIIYFIKNKVDIRNLISYVFLNLIFSLIYTNFIEKSINTVQIYYIFSISILVFIILYYVLNKINESILYKLKLNKKYIFVISAILLIYFVIAFNLSKPLYIKSNNEINSINRVIYGIKYNSLNSFNISVKELEVDSRYSVFIYEENNNFDVSLIKRFDYFTNTSGNYDLTFIPKSDTKKLLVTIECTKGNIEVMNCKFNNKNIILDYLLLPSDYIFRLEDSIVGNTSFSDRVMYTIDSLKLIKQSPIIGLGGEGFMNNYKKVQTKDYTSTEAHNSFLQIFVESGILGGTIVILLLILAFKGKYSIYKLTFLLFVIHSFVDLNFSYMIGIVIFDILLCKVLSDNYDISSNNQ